MSSLRLANVIAETIARRVASPAIRGGGGVPVPDFYVDSVNGDDGNDGLTAESAFETIAAVQTAALAFGNGVVVGLAGGSSWREMLDLSSLSNVTVMAVDVTDSLPVLDAADVIAGEWDDSTDRADANTNVYSQTLTWDGGTKTYSNVWEDGVKLSPASSLANCQATAGTFWTANGVSEGASGTAVIVYVHPRSSTNANSDGKLYEYAKRSYGLKLGDNSTAKGIRTRRQTASNGSLELKTNARVTACLAEDGVKHEVFVGSGIVEKSIAWHPYSDNRGDGTAFVAFEPLGDGKSYTFRECFAKGPRQSGSQAYDGFFAHTGSFTDIHTSGLVEDCSGVDCTGSMTACTAISMVERRNWAHNCSRLSGGTHLGDGALTNLDCKYTLNAAGITARGINLGGGSAIVEGLRVYAETVSVFDGVQFSTSNVDIRKSAIVINTEDSFSYVTRTGNLSGRTISFTDTIFESRKNVLYLFEWFTAGHQALATMQNNVYYAAGASAIRARVSGTNYTTAAAYLAALPETGSITTDPGLVDPANGDFSLSAPLANGAGLERPNIDYTPIPADLAAAEAWVISQLNA